MTRKIIQISTSGVNNTQQTQTDFILTALCNDGTVWNKFGHQSSNWLRVDDIPQDLRRRDYPNPPPTTTKSGG